MRAPARVVGDHTHKSFNPHLGTGAAALGAQAPNVGAGRPIYAWHGADAIARATAGRRGDDEGVARSGPR